MLDIPNCSLIYVGGSPGTSRDNKAFVIRIKWLLCVSQCAGKCQITPSHGVNRGSNPRGDANSWPHHHEESSWKTVSRPAGERSRG